MFFFWLLALIGHVVLWVAVVNRSHAYDIPRWLVELSTIVSGIALLAVPGWAVWEVAGGGWNALRNSLPLFAYGVLAAVIAVVGAVWRVALAMHPERRGVVAPLKTHRYDLREKHGLDHLRPVPRAFCRLPGNEVLTLSVEEKRVTIPGLPQELEGLRIAHLSDLHMSGRFGVELYQDVMQIANETGPDLIALTGDLIEKNPCHDWIASTYGRLSAPLGVCYVLGNHDKKCDHQTTRQLLDQAGIVDVSRQGLRVEHNGATIELVGNEVPWFGPPSEFSGEPADLRLVLAHSPDQFAWAVDRDAHLMLAGHNHGGQVRFPPLGAILSPSVHGTRYNSGTFRQKNTVMHVNRGTGSLAPFRYFCPPELTVLVLARQE